jgi:hypothetical protein
MFAEVGGAHPDRSWSLWFESGQSGRILNRVVLDWARLWAARDRKLMCGRELGNPESFSNLAASGTGFAKCIADFVRAFSGLAIKGRKRWRKTEGEPGMAGSQCRSGLGDTLKKRLAGG